MGRTWLVRGAVAAVVAVLVGAWAVGVSGLGDSRSPTTDRTTPASPDSSRVPEVERPAVRERVKPRRARKAARNRDAVTERSPDSADEPADDAPRTSAPKSPHPTPDPTGTSDEPSDPPPPPAPSDPPSQPSDDCTDLVAVIDCVLNPVTAHP
jgi:hypothetical protein